MPVDVSFCFYFNYVVLLLFFFSYWINYKRHSLVIGKFYLNTFNVVRLCFFFQKEGETLLWESHVGMFLICRLFFFIPKWHYLVVQSDSQWYLSMVTHALIHSAIHPSIHLTLRVILLGETKKLDVCVFFCFFSETNDTEVLLPWNMFQWKCMWFVFT